jgi:pimeloyl-ACP methyl ester carboxylesterase
LRAVSLQADLEPRRRLLLVHPGFFSRDVWLPAARHLRSSFEVMAPTLAGHTGGPAFPAGVRPGVGSIADQLERELDGAGWDTAHIAGCSYGGLMALELARRGRARSVFAIAPGGDFQRVGALARSRIAVLLAANRAATRALRPQAERLCRSSFGRWLIFRQGLAHPGRLEPELAALQFRAIADCPDYMAILRASLGDDPLELGEIDCPVLVVCPEHDRLLPFRRYGRPLVRDLRAYDLRRLEDVGHLAMLDDPQGIATLIEDFIANTSTESATSELTQHRPQPHSCTPTRPKLSRS